MLAVRSFLLLSLAALLSALATARTDPLRPLLHPGHLSHESLLHPSSLSPRSLLRARQALVPTAGENAAARAAQAQRQAVSRLDSARRAVEAVGSDVTRRAERVRRARGGAREQETVDEEGAAVHDTLFRLIQILSASADSPSTTAATSTYTSDDPLDAIADFAAAQRHPAVAAPSASPAPAPSGHVRARRSLPARADRDPLTALAALLDTLDRTISVPLGDILPSLPPVLRDAVRALLESVGEETAGVVEEALLQGGVDVAGAEQVLLGLGGGGIEIAEGKEERMAALLRLVRGSVASV